MPMTSRYAGMRVEAHSPDGSVHARLAVPGGLDLDYLPGGLDHTDDELERQLRYVLRSLLATATNAMSEARGGTTSHDAPDGLDARVAAARGERARELLETFDAVDDSADGSVHVRLTADGSIGVDIAYGAVDAHGGEHLVDEALHATRRLFAAQAARFDEVLDEVVNRMSRSELEERIHGGNRY
ncbi:hypothetical protein [Phytomonospora endophytica]|uniref:Uncharacterized protein n=1 Tax=Phytomonospora endophytica TaxID=714109 RepID=A0A841FPF5_9ACTN|nr:hypothetical protein [Phytomonospora endophytica]MBB6037995.1 hypothetical protein [Phytomonospora endophytica]GIG68894.1 hypothetical protein Pen01_51890 [Phytomonospora endophytica]